MEKRNIEKAAALIIAALCIVLYILMMCMGLDVGTFGVATHPALVNRLIYSFFHASILHLLLNVWVWLSIVFIYKPSWKVLLFAYGVAACVPQIALTSTPTVGLSAIIYCLFGVFTLWVKRKVYFLTCIAIYLCVGLFLKNINGLIHLYAYLAGLLYSFLNTPLLCPNSQRK